MSNLRILVTYTLLSACTVHVVHAAGIEDELKRKLSEQFKEISIQQVNPSPLHGLYEVVTPTEIVYVDAKGEHMVIGKLLDVRTRENLTEQRWNDLHRIDFNSLPFERAIKIVKGNGSRKLAVFADPHCPFCQELEEELQRIDDLTLYVFLYPLEGIHPGATKMASDIWCSTDRAEAWNRWMLKKEAPLASECAEVPTAELLKLGRKLSINSTPTLIFADGLRIPGAIKADELESRLVVPSSAAMSHQ